MTDVKREYDVVGLGRMGGNLARQALEKGMRVVGYTRHAAPPDMIEAGLIEIRSYADFRKHLSAPRAVFVYPALLARGRPFSLGSGEYDR